VSTAKATKKIRGRKRRRSAREAIKRDIIVGALRSNGDGCTASQGPLTSAQGSAEYGPYPAATPALRKAAWLTTGLRVLA
jgi:hypothetical protein